MHIKQSIQTPEGVINFNGELSQEEADLVVKAGLLTLLRRGAFQLSQEQAGELQKAQKKEEQAQGYGE